MPCRRRRKLQQSSAWIRVFYLLTLQGIISKSTFDSRSNPSSSRRNQSNIYRFTLQGIIAKATVLLPKQAFSLGYYNCFSTLENIGSTHRSSDKNNRRKQPFPWSCHSLIVRSILLIFFVQILGPTSKTLCYIFSKFALKHKITTENLLRRYGNLWKSLLTFVDGILKFSNNAF